MKKNVSQQAPIRSVPIVTNMALESDSEESGHEKVQDRKMSALKEENK